MTDDDNDDGDDGCDDDKMEYKRKPPYTEVQSSERTYDTPYPPEGGMERTRLPLDWEHLL